MTDPKDLSSLKVPTLISSLTNFPSDVTHLKQFDMQLCHKASSQNVDLLQPLRRRMGTRMDGKWMDGMRISSVPLCHSSTRNLTCAYCSVSISERIPSRIFGFLIPGLP